MISHNPGIPIIVRTMVVVVFKLHRGETGWSNLKYLLFPVLRPNENFEVINSHLENKLTKLLG